MRAAVYHGPGDIRIDDVEAPRIQDPGDVIVKTRTASMCGSDLYLFNGEVEHMVTPGRTTLGHEVCAEVVEVGGAVGRFAVGDRVTFPYSVSCGTCFCCRVGQTAHCETSGKAIYGFGMAFGDLGGSQAEYVRVPLADGHLEHVPPEIGDEAAIFLSCNLPAAVTAVDAAAIEPTDTVAVVGCGPTGLLALELARQRTGQEILAFDRVPERLVRAKELGARPVDVESAELDGLVAEATSGRGVDKVIEFAGRGDAFNLAVSISRPGAVISGGGVYLEQAHPVSLFDMYFKNLQIRLNGFANAKTAQWKAMQMVAKKVIDPTTVVSHEVDLDGLPSAAAAFAGRRGGLVKMLVRV
ncbi:alcohol dehydrogenase catalytic domain-containing protein [Pseudonocardia asaccharolytica]|uniref:Glutathione-dependent formaldehyde dehydrogenase n=1 Tax=Pseudonocardia asaccharolytica DSM 44247 = NBRC 16224 TaxID=1123024 RepID=A0A511D748_9PSEU|nr:alcohol dehydrogenase catalytic domain-containing protein [Pseudonocardia asaccharolytica]GEL19434.1 glutathione-dependent formaldehyde dehydrogenase [Pseudonocardia asaccharolytica DSM 44247 = NBRC 16224]